jgi:hypothetical protein
VVISGQIYEAVVLHGLDGIRKDSYRRAVSLQVYGVRRSGWVHIPPVTETTHEPPTAA